MPREPAEAVPQEPPTTSALQRRPWGPRGWALACALVLLLGLLVEGLFPAPSRWTTRAAIGSLSLYQRIVSPGMERLGVECRFEPSCSHYAKATISQTGVWVGGLSTARRLLRCGPWTPAGTLDPPAEP